jgi:uncharacterized protein (DUF736 family)
MIIGKFVHDPREDIFWGEISFIDYVNVRLVPTRKSKAAQPDYVILGQSLYGGLEFGMGWKRKNAGNGESFVSILLDHPTWPAPITAKLVADDNDNTFSLRWRRQRGKALRPVTATHA